LYAVTTDRTTRKTTDTDEVILTLSGMYNGMLNWIYECDTK